MSLEYQVEQLVAVLSRSVNNSAVAEIIRQRDKALEDLKAMSSGRDWYQGRWKDGNESRSRLERSNAALRGVITRMKSKLKSEATNAKT